MQVHDQGLYLYVGEWKDGYSSGKGAMCRYNWHSTTLNTYNWVYVGQYHNGRCHGKGAYTEFGQYTWHRFIEGEFLEGHFKKGKVQTSDGEVYEGEVSCA